jgi:hypothetical protein
MDPGGAAAEGEIDAGQRDGAGRPAR